MSAGISSLFFLLAVFAVVPQPLPANGGRVHRPPDHDTGPKTVWPGRSHGRSDHDTGLKILRPRSGEVQLQQVQMVFDAGRIIDSDWGRVKVKFPWNRPAEECSGYVNVFLENGGRSGRPMDWVVSNMHVPPPPHCGGQCDGSQHNEFTRGKPENNRHNFPITRFFDLRPGRVGMGRVSGLRGIVVLSQRPLPNAREIWRIIVDMPVMYYPVEQALYNAEGDLGEVMDRDPTQPRGFPAESLRYHLVGEPPQPTYPPYEPELDLAAPIEVFQDTWPNVQAGENQCVPMAHANAFRYLETQFNVPPLVWDLPHYAFRGLGITDAAGDVVFWTAVPDNSVVAHVDEKAKRAGVFDFETGGGSDRCQNIRGAFTYIQEFVGENSAIFRHQGGADFYGFGDSNCGDYFPEDIGNYTSNREGPVPTWQWIYDQLVAGRSVVISYGRYDSKGERTGGHMLRVYGAAQYSNKNYLYTLDDGNQGDNFVGTQLQTFEVADTENSGEDGDGETDNMLNIDGKSWEIEFALSTQALPGLLIP